MKYIRYCIYIAGIVLLITVGSQFIRFFSPVEEFIYGLETKAALPVPYLPERESGKLKSNEWTVAVFSQKNSFQVGEIFQTAGIPFYQCKNLEDANGTKILFLDLDIDHPLEFGKKTLKFLYEYVKEGGIVIGNGILSYPRGALKKLFGYRGYRPVREHTTLILDSSPYFFPYLNRPAERKYRLSAKAGGIVTNEIIMGTASAIAHFEDGSPAITVNHYGKGKAIILGISLYNLRYRNLVGRDAQANRDYINHFEPLSDMVILWMKSIYEKKMGKGFTLSSSPGYSRATLIVTHDVDYTESVDNMKRFMKIERAENAGATYNIWVKYLLDDKDEPFFNPASIKVFRDAQKHGFEIGAHTVEHTANFDKLPVGNCRESYPAYRPFSIDYHTDSGKPTLCGEVKVAKELLLGAGIKQIATFRSGELLYHPHLPEILERFGYRYSSCFSAEDVLSYFPYRYMYDYYTLERPSKIWEIPLVYEDEKMPPLFMRVKKAKELLEKISENGGVFTILIHPDLTWWRLKNFDLDFLEEFLKSVPENIATVNMKDFGEFWDKRDRIVWRYVPGRENIDILIWSPSDVKVALVPFGWKFGEAEGSGYKIWNGRILLDIHKGMNRWQIASPSS
jgi:hypothetical protein